MPLQDFVNQNKPMGVAPTPEKKDSFGESLVKGIAKPFIKTIASGVAAAEGTARLGVGMLTGGLSQEELNQANNAITRERDFGFLGTSSPVGQEARDREARGEISGLASFGNQLADVFGTGAEVASFVAPAGLGKGIAQGSIKATLPSLVAGGATSGILQGGGNQLSKEAEQGIDGSSLAKVLGSSALGGVAGAAIPMAGAGIGRLARPLARGAKGTATAAKGIMPNIVGRPAQKVADVASNIKRNAVDFMADQSRKSKLTQVTRRAIDVGIPEDVVNQIQKATPDDLRLIDRMKAIVDDIKAGSKKASVKDAVGEAATQRIRFVADKAKEVGQKIDGAIDRMGSSKVMNPTDEIVEKLAGEGIVFNDLMQIVETGEYTTNAANLFKKIIKELPESDFLTPRQLVNAKRKLAATIKEASQLKAVDKNALQVLVKQIEETLTRNLSPEYKQLVQEYAILKSAMGDFLKFAQLKQVDGTFFSIDDIVEKGNLRIGEKLMRLLGNASSKADESMNLLDDTAKQFGYAGQEDVRLLAEMVKLFEEAYDVVPKGGFAGGVKAGMEGALDNRGAQTLLGLGMEGLKKAAKVSGGNKQEALEALLKSLSR